MPINAPPYLKHIFIFDPQKLVTSGDWSSIQNSLDFSCDVKFGPTPFGYIAFHFDGCNGDQFVAGIGLSRFIVIFEFHCCSDAECCLSAQNGNYFVRPDCQCPRFCLSMSLTMNVYACLRYEEQHFLEWHDQYLKLKLISNTLHSYPHIILLSLFQTCMTYYCRIIVAKIYCPNLSRRFPILYAFHYCGKRLLFLGVMLNTASLPGSKHHGQLDGAPHSPYLEAMKLSSLAFNCFPYPKNLQFLFIILIKLAKLANFNCLQVNHQGYSIIFRVSLHC